MMLCGPCSRKRGIEVTSTTALKRFAWDRWTAAERRLTAARGHAARRAEAATEFWRRAFNRYEAREAAEQHDAILAHTAVAVDADAAPHFIRGILDEMPENYPDLGFVVVPMPKPRKGQRT